MISHILSYHNAFVYYCLLRSVMLSLLRYRGKTLSSACPAHSLCVVVFLANKSVSCELSAMSYGILGPPPFTPLTITRPAMKNNAMERIAGRWLPKVDDI